jgi:hypothetical protein
VIFEKFSPKRLLFWYTVDMAKILVMQVKPYFEGSLTKAILMTLPDGLVLQSNMGFNPTTPVFEAVLPPMAEREKVWARLQELRVAGGKFRAFTKPFQNSTRNPFRK